MDRILLSDVTDEDLIKYIDLILNDPIYLENYKRKYLYTLNIKENIINCINTMDVFKISSKIVWMISDEYWTDDLIAYKNILQRKTRINYLLYEK